MNFNFAFLSSMLLEVKYHMSEQDKAFEVIFSLTNFTVYSQSLLKQPI